MISVAAERPFKAGPEQMQLKLGTTRKWALGYFNGGTGAFSPTMDLILENEPTGSTATVSTSDDTKDKDRQTIVNKRVELRPGFGSENFETEDDNSKIQITTKRGRPNLKPERTDEFDDEFEEVVEYVDEYIIVVDTDGVPGSKEDKDKRVKVIVNINDIENAINNMKG